MANLAKHENCKKIIKHAKMASAARR